MSNITTPFGERPRSEPIEVPDRRGAEWGLASVLIGATLVLGSPVLLIVNILLAVPGPRALGMNPPEIRLATIGFAITLGLCLMLGVAGVVFGAYSMAAARSRGQSIALGLTGLLVCAVGLVMLFA